MENCWNALLSSTQGDWPKMHGTRTWECNLIHDKCVCRTASAWPGLLIIRLAQQPWQSSLYSFLSSSIRSLTSAPDFFCVATNSNVSAKMRRFLKKKILHTGNTWSSRMCVIQEYRFYTMSLCQYHGCCQYHESIFIPWVFVYTMSPCLYHESMSVPEAWFYTMSPCLYHESMSNPCFKFYTMRNTVFRYTKVQITRINKYKCQN